MVALNTASLLALVAACSLAPVIAQEGTAPQAIEQTEMELLEARVRVAEEALLEADVERAEMEAAEVVRALAALDAGADSKRAGHSALEARALDLVAQCRYALGDKSGATEIIERLVTLHPGVEVSGDIVGPKYVELFEARRSKLVGYLKVSCLPLPCERVLIDSAEVTLGSLTRVAVAAGSHEVVLERHGFEPFRLSAVEVAAGDSVEVIGEMEQVARDLILATRPAGVFVSLDGVELGVTEPGGVDGSSLPLVLRELLPGTHQLVLHAPCFQRVEMPVEVVLDALDPGALDWKTIELSSSQAYLEIQWGRSEGVVLIGGAPAKAGRNEVCPGVHEVVLSLAGRRAWFESVEVGHEQALAVSPRPRPSLAYSGAAGVGTDMTRLLGPDWNLIALDSGTVDELLQPALRRVLAAADGGTPLYPERFSGTEDGLSEIVRRLSPDADLLATWVSGKRGVRAVRTLVLLDARRDLVEASSWSIKDDSVTDSMKTLFRVAEVSAVPFLGLDLAGRRSGPPVIAAVHPASPLEGVAAGTLLVSMGGESISSVTDYVHLLYRLEPGAELTLGLEEGGERRDLTVVVGSNIEVVNPADYGSTFLLPVLARSESDRKTAQGVSKLAGSVRAGMILAALGNVRGAASALDGADVARNVDPSEDARGTLWFVLGQLMEQLEDGAEYAAEVSTRWKGLPQARFGGRDGPPLRYAGR